MLAIRKEAEMTLNKVKQYIVEVWRMLQTYFLTAFRIHPAEATRQILASEWNLMKTICLVILLITCIEFGFALYDRARRVFLKRPPTFK